MSRPVEAPKTLEIEMPQGVVENEGCFPCQPTRSLGIHSQLALGWSRAMLLGEFLVVKVLLISDNSNFHHFCVGKKC